MAIRIAIGVFLLLHGAVHMLWVSLARGWIPAGEGPQWSGRSWLLTGPLGHPTTLSVGAVVFTAATLAFVVAGVGVLAGQSWYPAAIIAASVLSIAAILGFWDGQTDHLLDKGFLGVVIDAAALLVASHQPWPIL